MSRTSLLHRVLLVAGWLFLAASRSSAGEAIKPFVDVTEAMGLKGNNGQEAAWGDFDNDGWVDVCFGGEVFRNEGGKRFKRIPKVAGPAIWGDFANDGYLNLFCCPTGNLYHILNVTQSK